ELLTEIHVPLPPPGSGTAYAKMPHPASGYVVVSAGALVTRDAQGRCAGISVAAGGLAGKPLRAAAAEAALTGTDLTGASIAAAAALPIEGADPEEDRFATAEYKL